MKKKKKMNNNNNSKNNLLRHQFLHIQENLVYLNKYEFQHQSRDQALTHLHEHIELDIEFLLGTSKHQVESHWLSYLIC